MPREDQQPSKTVPQVGLRIQVTAPEGVPTLVVPHGSGVLVSGCRAQPTFTYKPNHGRVRWGDLASLFVPGVPK